MLVFVCIDKLNMDKMETYNYVWLRRVIAWSFIALFAFYLGFRFSKNVAQRERQNIQMQQSK